MPTDFMAPIMLDPKAIIELQDMGPNLEVLEKEILKAERAGLDMKDVKARLDKAKKLRTGLLREYAS